MRSDELLTQATVCYRDETRGDAASAAASRARIIDRLRRRTRRRSRVGTYALAFAAVLVAEAVWAARTGRLRGVLERLQASPPEEVTEPALEMTKPTHELRLPGPTLTTATAPAPPPAPEVKHPPATRRSDREDELFAAATQAHFVAKDPAAALAAWDAYLAVAPSGRFAPEARYNHAVCLVRLGRRHEAVAELTPFAQGAYGDYRQRDAQRLVEALTGAPR